METEHTPNEFPFSSAAGAELIVPLTYATSSDGRQVVFTTMSAAPGPGPGPGGGGGTAAPLPLMSDPSGLLDALKHDTFVSDTFDSFAAQSDTVAVAARPTTVYQTGHEMPSNAELVHAVTELQLQQYVQQDETQDHQHHHHQQEIHQHQQEIQLESQQQQHDQLKQQQQQQHQGQSIHNQQQGGQQQQQQRLKSDLSEHVSLVEILHRPCESHCFVCDSPVSNGLVEIFGEANVLAASKTPVCVKLECLLSCTLPTEVVHSDVICVTCLHELEAVDGVDFKRKELERRSEELSSRIRRRFTRTVKKRQLSYIGWQPETEAETETETETGRQGDAQADGDEPEAGLEAEAGKAAATGDEAWSESMGSPPGSPPAAGDPSDPDDPDDLPFSPRKARKAAAARKKRTGMKARSKVNVADPRNPGRVKTKYIYDHSHACDVCGKTFAWQAHLAKHAQTHTGERPLTCHVCGQTFRWSSHLTSHIRRHYDDKPFACDVCGKRFVSGHVFKGHMRTHTDEKPYMCGVCGKQFRDKSNLRTHEWVHSDERPHRCEPCDRGFLTTSALKVHNRTVHGAPAAKAKKT